MVRSGTNHLIVFEGVLHRQGFCRHHGHCVDTAAIEMELCRRLHGLVRRESNRDKAFHILKVLILSRNCSSNAGVCISWYANDSGVERRIYKKNRHQQLFWVVYLQAKPSYNLFCVLELSTAQLRSRGYATMYGLPRYRVEVVRRKYLSLRCRAEPSDSRLATMQTSDR